ncbi:transglycosylase SLT domain-containing protein [Steroidobacter sp.]|uniref:transglycosylase SLT domain-containing protein n=1 Tax=Steroidobacter sp. TaxID=1978227 RepID=UPI001A54A193|nr:transglycosylase SLT domain-containing protein [Steroidobacter sp.]MBL8264749.1 transglycosylase SLT domain-containing protein [Steroidobacter sp.]
MRTAPLTLQLIVVLLLTVSTWFAANFIYQVIRKPSELFFPVSGTLYKTPSETWTSYEPIFRKHSTATVSAELLAALAQVEGSGNPIVRTYWRWSLTHKPFEVYRPASSAVGMYQITNGTFEETKQLCVHDHVVVRDGPWSDFKSCWFNSLYMRVIPSHAVEMTSAYLDTRIAIILSKHGIRSATLRQKQDLAAVIHVCGAGAGSVFARRGFQPRPGQHCGDHSVQGYISRVNRMKGVFASLAQQPKASLWQ